MKMPVLLSGHTMTPAGMLRPQSFQLSLRADGLSSGKMVIDSDNPDVHIGDWIQVWKPHNAFGEMCVMYVKNMQTDYVTGLKTLTLEHTFGLLQEMVVFGEVTAATMSGRLGATTCTATEAITYLLGRQTEQLWELGTCDFTDSQGWKFTNSDIYSDLGTITDAIIDCQWEFNQYNWPWTVSLVHWPTVASMEMRRNRNLETLKVTLDRSGMYTRVYPTGKNNLHIDSVNNNVSYLDMNTGTYGVIAEVITDSTISDATLLKAWAQKQLKRNSVPKVSVSISGYELSEATGEDMDHFTIGQLCRIPLPEYGITVTERLTELTWKDCIAQPDAVTCTLANELKTITGVLNEKARGGGGGSKKANTEHDCELKEGEEKIEEFDNSDIWINRDSVWAVCGAYEVTTWVDSQGVTHKKLKVKEGGALVIERNHTEYGIYDDGNLTGGVVVDKINGQTTTTINGYKINIGTLADAINGSSVTISAARINLDGYVTTSMMESAFQDIQQATVGQLTVSSYFTCLGHNVEWKEYDARRVTLSTSHAFRYESGGASSYGTVNGRVVTGYSDTTLYYLGR